MNSKRGHPGDSVGIGGRMLGKSSVQGRATRAEMTRDRPPVSITSLRSRLGPTIRSALSSAVETLLGEIVTVMSETEDELVYKERENERLKLRLDASERELKTLQDCLCSAQKLIDQLQGPFNTVHPPLPPMTGQHAYNNPAQGANTARLTHRSAADPPDPRCFTNSEAELGGALSDAIHGFEAREDFKSCHLSIQADGTVTNSYYDPMPVHGPDMCHEVPRSGEMSDRRLSHPTSHATYGVKEEQSSTPGPVHVRDAEHSVPTECDQGYVHTVNEESGPRSRRHAPKPVSSSVAHNGPSSSSTSPPSQGPSGLHPSARVASTAPSRPSPDTADSSPDGRRRHRPASELMGEVAGERPHLCLECGKTFRLLSSLKKHLRIHTGEKPYPCSVCGRRFRESGALKTHLRIHTGEKPYACTECGARFRHLDGLRKHGRTHTGEKPYGCGVCGKRLSRLQHLKHHQRIHTGERLCRCPLCRRTFSDAAGLRKHLLSTHQGEPGMEEAHDRVSTNEVAEEELQPSVEDEEMRFGMWGGEEEREEAEAAVDCV